MELNREKAMDILDRFCFFQGQRAGRELWNGKPFDVQEQDIADFIRDVALLKNYIKELTEENEGLRNSVVEWNEYTEEANKKLDKIYIATKNLVEENERYKRYYLNHEYDKLEAATRADTVRKMKERLMEKILENTVGNDSFAYFLKGYIDQVAKEMEEGKG